MDETERDVIAALLKIVREHDLIPEQTYQVALNKLFCTFDAGAVMGYDKSIATKRSA